MQKEVFHQNYYCTASNYKISKGTWRGFNYFLIPILLPDPGVF